MIFPCSVDVRDDCDVKKVEIQVMPQGLSAVAIGAALRVGADRHQRRADHHRHGDRRQRQDRHATLDVTAPESRDELGPERERRRLQRRVGRVRRRGLVPSLAMLLLFSPPQPAAAACGRSTASCPDSVEHVNEHEHEHVYEHGGC
jgi:hypothetical protein